MESASRSKGRRYGFACLVCRRRKVKCDGRWPTCVNCARLKETCSYKEKTAYTVHLAEALRSEQVQVQELQKHIRELAAMDNARRDRRLADLVSQLDLNGPEPADLAQSTDVRPPSTGRGAQDRYMAEDGSNDGDIQFSIDTEGRVSLLVASCFMMVIKLALTPIQQHYFGATSRFHPMPGHDHRLDTEVEINEPETQEIENYHRKWLYSNARFQGPWERMAHANMSNYTHVDPTICSSLLDVYWSWQAPLHNCVYRRCE